MKWENDSFALVQRMVKDIIIIMLLTIINSCMTAQLCYPIVGNYKGKSAQGMAIWGNLAYLFNDGGHCRVLNLVTETVNNEFDLASAGKNTHVNSACFGKEYYKGNTIPVIYISEYNLPSRCFVESIGESESVLVQTIQIIKSGKPQFVQSWIVDTKCNSIYALVRVPSVKGNENSDMVRISKYRLPLLSDGNEIILNENDCIDSFFVKFASGTQGGVIKGRYMYLPTGLQESARGRFNAERAIQVIDLVKKKLVKRIDLSFVTVNEPEDLDFYKTKALLYCGQEGGIYQVKIN